VAGVPAAARPLATAAEPSPAAAAVEEEEEDGAEGEAEAEAGPAARQEVQVGAYHIARDLKHLALSRHAAFRHCGQSLQRDCAILDLTNFGRAGEDVPGGTLGRFWREPALGELGSYMVVFKYGSVVFFNVSCRRGKPVRGGEGRRGGTPGGARPQRETGLTGRRPRLHPRSTWTGRAGRRWNWWRGSPTPA